MRLVCLKSPAALLAASAVLVSCAPRQPPPPVSPQTTHRVNLAVGCVGDSVSFTLSPWGLRVIRGDAIEWRLTVTMGSVPEFGIERVRGGTWPYVNTARIPGTPQRPAVARDMVGNAQGRYRYQVDLTCEAGPGKTHSVVVDPDIWVNLAPE